MSVIEEVSLARYEENCSACGHPLSLHLYGGCIFRIMRVEHSRDTPWYWGGECSCSRRP